MNSAVSSTQVQCRSLAFVQQLNFSSWPFKELSYQTVVLIFSNYYYYLGSRPSEIRATVEIDLVLVTF